MPSTEIYFHQAMQGLIGTRQSEKAPIIRLEPNVFRAIGRDNTTLVFRTPSRQLQAQILADEDTELWFFIDDDLWAAGPADGLPCDYSKRLIELRHRTAEPLIERSKILVTSSQRILDRFPCKAGLIVPPALVYDLPRLDHHNRRPGDAFDIVFSGTRSHLSDLMAIAKPLQNCLWRNPQWRLTTFLGSHAPRSLRLRNARHLDPMDWPDYRRFVSHNRFHVALCPLRPTAFNAARSATRLLDNAAFGSATVYSEVAPYDRLFESCGRSVGESSRSHDALEDCLHSYEANPSSARAHARLTARRATIMGAPRRQQDLWRTYLSLSQGN